METRNEAAFIPHIFYGGLRINETANPAAKIEGNVLVFGPLSRGVERHFHQLAADIYEKSGADGVIWVCVQNSAKKTREKLNDAGARFQNLWFVDLVGREARVSNNEENTVYGEGPADYTHALIMINGLREKIGRCVVVFDNLNAALSYVDAGTLIKFLRTLNNRLSADGSAAVYMLAEGAADAKTENAIQAAMDTIFKVGEKVEVISGGTVSQYLPTWEEFRSTTWRDVFMLEKPLLYLLLLTLIVVNVFLTIMLVRVAVT
jgi:hypothetical protein